MRPMSLPTSSSPQTRRSKSASNNPTHHLMQFHLYYRGPLASNGTRKQKHELRMHFHKQLRDLWKQLPLIDHVGLIGQPAMDQLRAKHEHVYIVEKLGETHFAPLVTDRLHLICDLSITMLRPEEPGSLISKGDIDNRLKTLFDALSKPPHENQLVDDSAAHTADAPVFCLLKDDNLISSLSVRCDRLLDPESPAEVILIIDVNIRATRQIWANVGIGS